MLAQQKVLWPFLRSDAALAPGRGVLDRHELVEQPVNLVVRAAVCVRREVVHVHARVLERLLAPLVLLHHVQRRRRPVRAEAVLILVVVGRVPCRVRHRVVHVEGPPVVHHPRLVQCRHPAVLRVHGPVPLQPPEPPRYRGVVRVCPHVSGVLPCSLVDGLPLRWIRARIPRRLRNNAVDVDGPPVRHDALLVHVLAITSRTISHVRSELVFVGNARGVDELSIRVLKRQPTLPWLSLFCWCHGAILREPEDTVVEVLELLRRYSCLRLSLLQGCNIPCYLGLCNCDTVHGCHPCLGFALEQS
mmetsp:Transcript_41526/g.83465  ORF Transcript_41526/g.83465 Transcript_41526/m.83465 type:complete len:303 (+) Transcript_41526:214-1122(+)